MQGTGSYFRCKSILFILIAVILAVSGPDLAADTGTMAVVTNRFANVRSGPGTQYTRLGQAYQGSRYPVTTVRQEWVEISFNGRPAWIYRNLVSLEQQAHISQSEVDMVDLRVKDLNNRLERLTQKLEQATMIIEQRYPDEPETDTILKRKAPSQKMQPAPRVSPAWVFIPGGPRLAAGDHLRGWGLLGVTLACAGGGYYYYDQYRGFKDDYQTLDSGAPPEEFDKLIEKADNRRKVSNGLIYAAAGLYAVNVLDYFFFLPRSMTGMQVNSAPEAGGRINLSMSTDF